MTRCPNVTIVALFALASLQAFATGAAAQTTALVLDSQPGDYIGGGIDQTITEADGTFTASRNFANGVSLYFDGGPDWWYLDFAGPMDAPIAVGVYEEATRFPFQSPTGPGLSIHGSGRGCNELTGRFEVLEVVYGPTGDVQRFAATFEQHCEGAAAALLGSIQFNSTLPPPPPPPAHCVTKTATIPDLLADVIATETSDVTKGALRAPLLTAEWAVTHRRPRLARSMIAVFTTRAIGASNLARTNPNSIGTAAANTLGCAASNVLLNIEIP
jgi:hypothetical protein